MSTRPRPVLRYHGGKWRLAPWIISHFPEHRVYVEPFGGAASVLLRKPRSYAEVYNDIDGEIVAVFRILREPRSAAQLRRLLHLTPFARAEFLLVHKNHSEPLERARRTIIRSFMGFGSDSIWRRSGFRSNSNRSGTIPAHDWANLPAALEYATERLRGVVIENRNALEVIQQHDSPQTLFYVDPPYPHGVRRDDKRYRHEMDDGGHRALATRLRSVDGKVVLSSYPGKLYSQLYRGWRSVRRHALADGARPRTEVLYINFLQEAK